MHYTIIPYEHGLYKERLYALWEEIIRSPSRIRLEAIYSNNSYGTTSTYMLCYGHDLEVVGSVSLYPCYLNINGRRVKTGINCDMMVLKQHRTLGPAIMVLKSLVRYAVESGYQILLAMPNKDSHPVFKRAGYVIIGKAYRWTRLLRSESKTSSIISNKHLRETASAAIDFGLRWLNGSIWLKIKHWRSYRIIEEEISSFDSAHLSKMTSKISRMDCTQAFLNWRYLDVGSNNSEIFILTVPEEGLFGFVVYYASGKNIIIEDIFCTGMYREISIILSKFIDKIYRRNMDTIQIIFHGPNRFDKIMRGLGFVKREGRDIFAKFIDKSLVDHIQIRQESLFFDGNMDL